MPYVNIRITRDGATQEQKATLITEVTPLLANTLGKNPQTTVVIIDEVDPRDWGIAGETIHLKRASNPVSQGNAMHHDFLVYSGPEATGRVFHAMIYAKQAHQRGDAAYVYFAAEGTAWPMVLADRQHPLHDLFAELLNARVIAGTCENCARSFGNSAASDITSLVRGSEASFGQNDVLGFVDAGHRVWTF